MISPLLNFNPNHDASGRFSGGGGGGGGGGAMAKSPGGKGKVKKGKRAGAKASSQRAYLAGGGSVVLEPGTNKLEKKVLGVLASSRGARVDSKGRVHLRKGASIDNILKEQHEARVKGGIGQALDNKKRGITKEGVRRTMPGSGGKWKKAKTSERLAGAYLGNLLPGMQAFKKGAVGAAGGALLGGVMGAAATGGRFKIGDRVFSNALAGGAIGGAAGLGLGQLQSTVRGFKRPPKKARRKALLAAAGLTVASMGVGAALEHAGFSGPFGP